MRAIESGFDATRETRSSMDHHSVHDRNGPSSSGRVSHRTDRIFVYGTSYLILSQERTDGEFLDKRSLKAFIVVVELLALVLARDRKGKELQESE